MCIASWWCYRTNFHLPLFPQWQYSIFDGILNGRNRVDNRKWSEEPATRLNYVPFAMCLECRRENVPRGRIRTLSSAASSLYNDGLSYCAYGSINHIHEAAAQNDAHANCQSLPFNENRQSKNHISHVCIADLAYDDSIRHQMSKHVPKHVTSNRRRRKTFEIEFKWNKNFFISILPE